jgi:ADP-ribose pyrophosphatase YjhB (NUDIX family)
MSPADGDGAPNSSPKTWPVKTATSYGGVVVRTETPQTEVALIKPRREEAEGRAGQRPKEEVWALPKGGKDEEETPEVAALREVREETGLEAEIIAALEPITYWFVWAPERVRYKKTVHFFLMRATGGDISNHDNEVEEVRFFPLDEAADQVTYASERKLIEQARATCERL